MPRCRLRAFFGGCLAVSALLSSAEKAEDLVTSLPGFPPASSWGFKAYSGFIDVPGPINGYDRLKIHYQLQTSQRDSAKDPLLIWHQGGPGGSSIDVGLYGELGAFLIGDKAHGDYLNPHAWNKVANMLYLESPAGSGTEGYSQCMVKGSTVPCQWDDKSQAEAYAHTLQAFFKAFPEYSKNDFYLTGESYFGQYGPNIAHYILNNEPFKSSINLKGIAAGNACWGGTETCVACNGPSQDKIDVDLFFGKALFSPKLKKKIDATCQFPTDYKTGAGTGNPFACDAGAGNAACSALIAEMRTEVGPHNVYNIYDDCPRTHEFFDRTGKDVAWLTSFLREGLHDPSATRQKLKELNGGYEWDCVGDVDKWITSAEVKKALHLDGVKPDISKFSYNCSGPASITLWPELAQKIRVLIYNGDADACVPFNGNEAWIASLESKGQLKEKAAWKPWYTSSRVTPAGYITKYQAPGANVDFAFATVRLAGHMVPQFRPEAALVMLSNFLDGAHAEDADASEQIIL